MLLKAKLRPPLSEGSTFSIPRLDAALAEAFRHQAAFITAGAGYGKTTNVSRFLRKNEKRFVWLTLDEGDYDPASIVNF